MPSKLLAAPEAGAAASEPDIGVDYRITDHFAVGLVGSYAYTRTNLQPSGDIKLNFMALSGLLADSMT